MLEQIQYPIFETLSPFYNTCGFEVKNINYNPESKEYDACTFLLDNIKIIYRTAKITPTKNGLFVTIWKRNNKGITEPFNINDDFDAIIITVQNAINIGQFIFTKEALAKNKIITQNNCDGKRGIRVYPPWDITTSKQAEKTQKWQLNYFITLDSKNESDVSNLRKILNSVISPNKINGFK